MGTRSGAIEQLALAFVDELNQNGKQMPYQVAVDLLSQRAAETALMLGVSRAAVLRNYLHEARVRELARQLARDFMAAEDARDRAAGGISLDLVSACRLIEILAHGTIDINKVVSAGGIAPACEIIAVTAHGIELGGDPIVLSGSGAARLLDALDSIIAMDDRMAAAARTLRSDVAAAVVASENGLARPVTVRAVYPA